MTDELTRPTSAAEAPEADSQAPEDQANDGVARNAVDVVDGPIGSATLKPPTDVAAEGADLDPVPGFEPPDTGSEAG